MSFKSISEFHNRTIDKLVLQAEQQKDLLSLVKDVLPEELATQTLHCVVHGNTLFVYTSAAVWASQLRFYQGAILKNVSPHVRIPLAQVKIRLLG
jgi:hypothetical protein